MEIEKINKKLLYLSFGLYCVLLIWVIAFKCGNPSSILGSDYIKEPLGFGVEINKYMQLGLKDRFMFDFTFRHDEPLYLLQDFGFNILIFIFLGLFLPLIYKGTHFIKCSLTGFAISLVLELYQLFTAFGSFSFLDILFNVIGTMVGVLIYMLLIKLINPNMVGKVVNIVNICVLVIFIPVLIFAIVYTGINFDAIIYRYQRIVY